MAVPLWLVPIGVVVGAYGTLVGAGGGFVLVPLLLLLYPADSARVIVSTSLAVVLVNGVSGSIAYARMGRIDYPSALLFAAAAVPGAVVGALATGYVPRRAFEAAFGLALLGLSGVLLLRPVVERGPRPVRMRAQVSRTVVGADGRVDTYVYDPRLGVGVSVVTGFVSSVFGIGGGIVHVPLLARYLNFPVHIAIATSQLALAVMALAGTVAHLLAGALRENVPRTVWLAIGVVVGAQLGARLSRRARGEWIVRALALALLLVAMRLLGGALRW